MAKSEIIVRNVVFESDSAGRIYAWYYAPKGQFRTAWTRSATGWYRVALRMLRQWEDLPNITVRYWFSRETAHKWAFIPVDLKKSVKERRQCKHSWKSIHYAAAYRKQNRAAWNYRCEHCGGYAR